MAGSEEGTEDRGGEVVFREYEKTDLKRCAAISAQAWPEIIDYSSEREGIITMEAYVDFNRASSNWQEVACASGTVVGILFGRLDRDMTAWGRFRGRMVERMVYLKLILGLYGRIPNRLKLIRMGMADDREKLRNTPESDGEVAYFVVAKEYRGKRIGRTLMDRFLTHARERGAGRIFVLTTEPGCDWGFYERYGFRHYSTFREEFTSFLLKREARSLIFTIDLAKQTQGR